MKMTKLKTTTLGYLRIIAEMERQLNTYLYPPKILYTATFGEAPKPDAEHIQGIVKECIKEVEIQAKRKNQNYILFAVEIEQQNVVVKDSVRGTVVATVSEI
jgi:hypothetical protein